MKKFYLITLFALALFTACKREDEKPANHLLGSWQKVKVESKVPPADWQTENQPCQLDDVEEYRPTGDWALFSGANQCSAGSGVTRVTRQQAASNTHIIYTFEGISREYESTVQELTAEKMILIQSTGLTNGKQIRYTFEKK